VGNLAGSLYIGARGNNTGFFNGYMDEVRISKGVVRHTANFTPATNRPIVKSNS